MKPIIVDIKDMSDSTEVYESKPNRFLIYTIYLILIILVVTVLWMSLYKMDIAVKSNGIFKGSNAVYEISSGITGSVKENHIENGQYVAEGDIIYVLNIEELSDTIFRYQDVLEASKERLEILSAYEKSLDGDKKELDAYAGFSIIIKTISSLYIVCKLRFLYSFLRQFSCIISLIINRGDRIRTCDLCVPNAAHYQAVLRPEWYFDIISFIFHKSIVFFTQYFCRHYFTYYNSDKSTYRCGNDCRKNYACWIYTSILAAVCNYINRYKLQ